MEKDNGIEPKSGSIPRDSVEAAASGTAEPPSDTSPPAGSVTEKAWKEFGIEGWDGKSKEQIAREVAFQRSVSGRQSAELGRLRKEHQTSQQKLAELQRLAGGNTNPEGQTVKEVIAEMEPAEKIAFFKELEEGDPRKAMRRALGDLGIPKKEDIEKMIEDGVKKQLGQYHEWNETNTLRSSNPKYVQFEEDVNWLKDPENGSGVEGRSRQECLELVVLGKENELLAGFTYELMKNSSMPFGECRRIAQLEISAQQTNDTAKDALKKEIKQGQRTSPSGSKTTNSDDRPKSWDDI